MRGFEDPIGEACRPDSVYARSNLSCQTDQLACVYEIEVLSPRDVQMLSVLKGVQVSDRTEGPEGEGFPEDFGSRVAASLMEIFWSPEIDRRGGAEAVGVLRKALAISPPGEPVRVYLNDEAKLVGQAVPRRAIAAGEPVTLEDISHIVDLYPFDVDEDAGWACLVVLPDGNQMVAFDFRRNRGRARGRLARADEFLASAEESETAGRVGPAIDSAHAAAELVVSALAMMLESEEGGSGRNSHGRRQGWLAHWTQLGNAPSAFSKALGRLGQLRGRARYADAPLDVDSEEVRHLIKTVGAMVRHARERVGEHKSPIVPEGD